MTPEEAEVRVKGIEKSSFDDEGAHSEEDQLYHDFVRYVAGLNLTEFTVFDVMELVRTAHIILDTENIQFARWCA